MKRVLRLTLLPAMLALYVIAIVACDDGQGEPCKVHRDCNTGDICRDEICGSPRPDGGSNDADFGTDGTNICTNDGVFCNLPSECCSNLCTQNVCGAQPGGNGPTCKNQLDSCLSTDECCQPYSCTKGLCR